MPRKKFRCAQCNRTFSMKAHLVRHTSTKHASGGRRVGRPRGRRRMAPVAPALTMDSGPDMDGFVSSLHSYREQLLDQQRTLATQLDAMDRAIGAMTGAVPVASRPTGRRGPGRPRGSRSKKGTLATAIEQVMRRATGALSPADISKAVSKIGYKSKAQDLTKAVSNALPKIRAVKRLGFGRYTI